MSPEHHSTKCEATPKRPRFVVPLEDIVMPAAFIGVTSAGVAVCLWLGLPFWGACIVGVSAAWLFVMGVVWLLSRSSKPCE